MALQAVKDLVENEGIVVFVGNASSSTDAAFKDYLDSKNIPDIVARATARRWQGTLSTFR